MWRRLKLSFLLISILQLSYGQLSLGDSLTFRSALPYIQQLRGGNIQGEKYLAELDSVFSNSGSTDYALGLKAHLVGGYLDVQGETDEALEKYDEARKVWAACCTSTLEYIENDIRIGFVSIHAGLINFDTLHFQKGYKYVEVGYRKAREYGYEETAQRMLDFMGDYHYYSAFRIENFAKALELYEQLYQEIDGSPDSTYRYIDSRLNLANVHRRLDNQELSEAFFQEAMQLAEKYDYHRILYSAHIDKAEIFEENEQLNQALALKLKAYEYALLLDDREITNRVHRQLYSTYNNLGDHENALKFLELHLEGVREMNKAEALQLQAQLESQNLLDQQALEIATLENKQLSTVRNSLIALAFLSIIGLAGFAFAYKRQKTSNLKLKQKNEEILMAQLKGQNMERKRMAGELHDNLNTKIAAVRFRLEAQNLKAEGQSAEMMDETISLVNDIYEDVRLISHNLVPETVEELGLVPSLEKLINSLNNNDSTQFSLISKLGDESLIKNISYELYNIVFELINNILKHADADNAWISISEYDHKLSVTVKDDGKGFDVDQNMGGFGLKSINSRVEKLSGKYSVESSLNNGTRYTISIPVNTS